MKKQVFFLAALPCLALALAAQGMASFLPPATATKAARLLATIDRASSEIESRREAAWAVESSAEAATVEAYALSAASRAGRGPWASSDGTAKASESSSSLTDSRSRAKAAALSLATGGDGSSEPIATRDAAAEALEKLVQASGVGGRAALGLEKYLSGRSRESRLFPEIAEIEEQLRKAGGPGARAAAAAVSRRSAEGIALSLIASKPRIIALAPGTDAAFARLEAVSRAYRAWIGAFAAAAYPGDLPAASDLEKSAVAAGINAFIVLRPDRAAALVEAMAAGDGRDMAAARAARRLAGTWIRSPEPRRRDLAALCGFPDSSMALFCFAIAPVHPAPAPAQGADALAIMYALNGLAAEIAEEEASPGAARGPEPSLILLEKPELAAAARAEPRYASMFAEASRRLGAIYSQAAEEASSSLEASPTLYKAAARGLGTKPASVGVRAVDLTLPPEESGRRIAFVATVSDSAGSSITLPLDAATAGEPYAQAFAKAAGLGAIKDKASSILSRYGQWVVSAYDPEGADDGLVVDVFPAGGGPPGLGIDDLELALLGGWRP
jgi:hypothetical protein